MSVSVSVSVEEMVAVVTKDRLVLNSSLNPDLNLKTGWRKWWQW